MRLDHLLSKERLWKQSKELHFCQAVKYERVKNEEVNTGPVVMRAGGTPVPIPNTTVKTCTADGTILETIWESRRLPDLI